MQTSTIGDQINQKVDIQQVGTDFVNYFYNNLKTNLQELVNSGLLRNHTRIKYMNKEYKGNELIQLLLQLSQEINFIIEENIIMDSGGRRADILTSGKIQSLKTQEMFSFSQYFTIANNKDGKWFLHNSLLSILKC